MRLNREEDEMANKYVVEGRTGTLHGVFTSAAGAQRWADRELISGWAIRPIAEVVAGAPASKKEQ